VRNNISNCANKKCLYQASESSFGGVQVADRVRETVPRGQISNGKKPGSHTCLVSAPVVCAVDFVQRNGDVSA